MITWNDVLATPEGAEAWLSGKTFVLGYGMTLDLFGSIDPDDPRRVPHRNVYDEHPDRFFSSVYLPNDTIYYMDDEQLADLKESLEAYERERHPLRDFIGAAQEPRPLTLAAIGDAE